jgi:hypothetical protein
MSSVTSPETEHEQDTGSDIPGVALSESETVHHDLRPAWTNYTRQLALFWLGYPLYRAWRDRKTVRYIITDQRLIIKEGSLFGAVTTDEYELADVERIQTEQTYLERQFGVGTITVHMRHEHHEAERFDVTLPSIPDHQEAA